jgi:DNA-binding NtrC family response regulator
VGELLASVCRRGDHEVDMVTSAEAALDHLAISSTDLLIADIEMAGDAPSRFMAAVRHACPGLPVIATVAHDEPLLVAELFGDGAVDVLKKPFAMEDLGIRIALVEERRRYVRDLANERMPVRSTVTAFRRPIADRGTVVEPAERRRGAA